MGDVIRYDADNRTLLSVPAITTITILRTATSIKGVSSGIYAFFTAKDTIQSVDFEDNSQMESISSYCFFKCAKLRTVEISKCSKLTTIGAYAFCECTSLSLLQLPSSLQTVGEYGFAYSGLTEIHFPAATSRLDRYMFFKCKQLTTFTLHPNSTVPKLTDHMFTETKLVDLHLTKTIDGFSGDNFEHCYHTKTFTVDPENKNYKAIDNVVFTYGMWTLIYCPSTKTGEYTIPEGVGGIINCAFHCSKLTKINFPSTLKSINGWAFINCGITELKLPPSCKSIGQSAFSGCLGLKEIVFPDGLETITAYAFKGCTNLVNVTLPATLKSIGGSAFEPHIDLKFDPNSDLMINDQKLIINKDMTKIFICAGDVETINVPATIIEIGQGAFENIKTIKTIIVPDGSNLQNIRSNAFCGSSIVNINLPPSLRIIEGYAFGSCTSLKGMTFGSSLTNIYEYAFNGCTQLDHLIFTPGSNIVLSYHVFESCTGITSIEFNGRISEMGDYCFNSCTQLASIELSGSLQYTGVNAFSYTGVSQVTFTGDSLLTVLSVRMFYNANNLVSINIPEGIQEIREEALAFTSIKTIVLSSSVKTLKEMCFQGNKNLETFIIPAGSVLDDIQFGVFMGCESFATINNSCDSFSILNKALFAKNQTELIILPPQSDVKYFSFPETLKTIRLCALQNCKNLHVIFLPYSVTNIKEYAFDGCENLRSINIPKSVSSIGTKAFLGCKKLQCGISIENTDPSFRNMLITQACMPKKAIIDCNLICSMKNQNRHQINTKASFVAFLVTC